MKLLYQGRHIDGVDVALPDGSDVTAVHAENDGKPVDFPTDVGVSLLEQGDEWKPIDAEAKKASQAIADALAAAAADNAPAEAPAATTDDQAAPPAEKE